jgi:hypothetical protein
MNEKRIAIGDIHGRGFWKHYLEEDFTAFYILGDYFDNAFVPPAEMLQNFGDIVTAARKDSRIHLCLGNHDYHYLTDDPEERYSRYNTSHAAEYREALMAARDLLRVVYETDDRILISHAGLSETFMLINGFKAPAEVNGRFRTDPGCLRFNGGDVFGDDVTQGPLWIRPTALLDDHLIGYSQIVGHTVVRAITSRTLGDGHTLTLIDTGDTEAVYRF